MKGKLLFNSGWKFIKMPIHSALDEVNQVTEGWNEVDLPHDWLIYNTEDLYETGDGWYTKDFVVSELENTLKHIYFDGVYMDSVIYVNNQKAFEWKYGYSSFQCDITKYLTEGINNIKVQVIHESPNSRWYSGAGIYRDVYLLTTPKTYLVSDGIYIVNEKTETGFDTNIQTEVKVTEQINGTYSLRQSILTPSGEAVASTITEFVPEGEVTVINQKLHINHVRLWSLLEPNLYTAKTELLLDGNVIDEIQQRIGYRTLTFDNNNGFFLNGEYVKIHGVCEHHDLGALGAAFNKTAMRRKITILKEMGVNAIRTSHNMPAKELMELSDEMGILINSEAFDMWEYQKTEYDYGRFFLDWYKKDVASWVRRDRNHPSIIMWSIGNEIPDTNSKERGMELTKMLKEEVLLHDPKENAKVTFGSNHMAQENTQRCANELPLVGYNYAEYLYEEHHKKYPDWVIYGSETSSTIQSRGVYHFPANIVTVTHDDKQCSSLNNCCTSWGAKNTQDVIVKDRDAKYCLGQFLWTGFDYIGEPTPYITKNSYFGQIDTAGFKKDTFYFYQAEWTDYKTNPMVHILPYWDFNEGQLIDIKVYSNAPKVELFVNDVSYGTVMFDHVLGKQLCGEWQVPYAKGYIKAVAYDEENQIIAQKENHSFTDAKKIVLTPDKTTLSGDGLDLAFVEISMEDKDGYPVENANNRVEVKVTGAGRLIGLDNGDSSDYDSYKGTSRRLFNGKLLAIIGTKQEAGPIEVTVSSKGVGSSTIQLEAMPCEKVEGISAVTENLPSKKDEEIPIRKIELENLGTNRLSGENSSTKIKAVVFPEYTTYEEIHWVVVTPSGIESNLAVIEGEGREITLKALGDGDFRLRCYATNGGEIPKVISELEFSITGLGDGYLNPYETVAAGLYKGASEAIEGGREGSIVLSKDKPVSITYSGVDFGEYGSDQVTIPIYYLHGNETPVEIWEGIPDEEGSKLIISANYEAKPKWDTFFTNTFQLPYRLKGIKTISFVFRNRLSMKSFTFKKYNKGTSKLLGCENTRIYGDTYQLKDTSIHGIGNNVSIEYDNMDFGEEGVTKLILNGRSNTSSNSIHIKLEGTDGERKEMVVVPGSREAVTREFTLPVIKGKQKVTFIFLPGSNFDLEWFWFQ